MNFKYFWGRTFGAGLDDKKGDERWIPLAAWNLNEKQAAARRVAIVSIICPLGSVGKGGDSEEFGVHIITTKFQSVMCYWPFYLL